MLALLKRAHAKLSDRVDLETTKEKVRFSANRSHLESQDRWVAGYQLSPLQVLAEFPELPYVPFGQDSPSMNAELRDVGDPRSRRMNLSILQNRAHS